MRWRTVAFLLAGVCVGGLRAAAPSTAGDDPRQAVIRFARAVAEGDGPTLASLVFVADFAPGQRQALRALLDHLEARTRLHQAALRKFGADGSRFAVGPAFFTASDPQRIASARVSVHRRGGGFDHTTAFVHVEGETSPVELRRLGGGWRVVLEFVESAEVLVPGMADPSGGSPATVGTVERMTLAVEQVIEAIGRDQFASAAEAEAELCRRLSRTMGPVREPR